MPINKKESLIYTIMMCLFMVYFMSVYNLSYQVGFGLTAFQLAWNELPLAIVVAFLIDWFVVSKPAKKLAFKIVDVSSAPWKKILCVSFFMICGMVLFMSLFGAIVHPNIEYGLFRNWGTNIAKNIIVALPLQIFIAGPIIRTIFRKIFPIGTIQEMQKA